jgi:hydrogenase maturation protease
MGACIVNSAPREQSAKRICDTRILCLGNDLLADDSFGLVVADHLRPYATPETEIISTPEAGFHLVDYVLDTHCLIVVDGMMTGKAPVGTIYVLQEEDVNVAAGGSPHYVGLYESLVLARTLNLPVAKKVIVVAVEIADCTTMGAKMNSALYAAIPEVIRIVRSITRSVPRASAA